MTVPPKLQAILDTFDLFSDPADRTSLLLSYADQFKEVPVEIATRPFNQANLVPHCESEAYVWAVRQPDRTLKLYFAVENPSGVSARALAAILDKSLSGLPPAYIEVGSVDVFRDEDVAYASGIWASGGSAELHVWPGAFHGFDLAAPQSALSVLSRETRTKWVRRTLGI